MPIILKRATISDIPKLIELEQSVAGTNIYSPELEKNEWIDELQKSNVFLIEKDGAMVGNISYEKKSGNHVYISGLVVKPEYQGQGIAREVLHRILQELKDIKRIDLVTHPDNVRAIKLYQSLGFIVESRKENYYDDGEPRLILVLKKTMKIIFWGTSKFAVPALEALQKEGFEIIAVITTPDQPVGRKKVITPPPVKITAEKLGLKVIQPAKLKDGAFFEEYKLLAPDICVVAAYGKIIPERYINIPKHFLNIHPSLLPKHRGPTPIQAAIFNGETKTGVTIMQIDKDMDHGPIFVQKEFSIGPDETYLELHDRLAQEGAGLLVDVIKKTDTLTPHEQDHTQATFCKMFEREEARIDWSHSPQEIYNQIRALNPEPGTWTTWQDKVLNIKAAFVETCATAKVIGDTRSASQGKPELKLTKVQLEGKNETSMKDFLSGHPDFNISQLK